MHLSYPPRSRGAVYGCLRHRGRGHPLSQCLTADNKFHSCAFFSRRISPAERNYNVGNQELLAVVLEWRHWLSGTAKPFIVWTDQKNLSYHRTASRLNFLQARWALFLCRFHFTLTYHPGSRNIKPDTLSRQFTLEGRETGIEMILSPECVVGVLRWQVEREVQDAI